VAILLADFFNLPVAVLHADYQKHPDLARLIQAWPTLPEQAKTTIKALIQTHKAEKK